MKAVLTAIIAAIEAMAVALAGLAVVAVPTLLLWWLVFSLGAEPEVLVGLVAGIWLLAHFAPFTLPVTAQTALEFGLAPEPFLVTLSLAPLGLTVLTVALGARSGLRLAERGGPGASGVLGGVIGFGVASAVVVLVGAPRGPWPMWAVILVAALCYGTAAAVGFACGAVRLQHGWWTASRRWLLRRLEWIGSGRIAALPTRVLETVRLSAGALVGVVALGALGVAVAVVVGYVGIITLSQGLQLDGLGLLTLFLLDVVLLPVVCLWSVAWFSGAGFALGAGTSVTPFETLLGPLPALPILGAIPQGWGWAGGLAPALVVLVGVLVGVLAGGRPELRRSSIAVCIVSPVIAAGAAGLAVAGLTALASGAIGPGRLTEVGARPWVVGGLIALELAIGLVPGVLARRLDAAARLRAVGERVGRIGDTADSPVSDPPVVGIAGDPDAETRPIDPLPVPQRERAIVDVAPAEVDRTGPDEPSDPPRAEDEAPSDLDPLLEAFSWDGAPSPASEPETPRWRRPWRRR